MELYERVDELIRRMTKSRTNLAKQLNIKQTTFNSWFSRDRQNNLLPVLFKIQEIYPHVSRDWLFFGEGEMTRSALDGPPVSTKRERELLLKIEQLSGLLIKLETRAADR